MSGSDDPHTAVKQELLVRYLDAWTPTVLKSRRRATYLEASRDGSAAGALRVFAEFADRLAGHRLDVVVLGAEAPSVAEVGSPEGLSVMPVADPEAVEVHGPVLAYLDLVAGGLDEPTAWQLVARLASGETELLLAMPPADAARVTAYRGRLADTGLPHVVHVELVDDAGRVQLLVFATAVEKHLTAFKEALWAVDEYAGIRYRDPRDPSGALVDISLRPQLLPLKRELSQVLAERGPSSVAELQHHTVAETIYRAEDAIRGLTALVSAGTVSREPEKGRISPRTLLRPAG
ncbi:MAG: hypothetical protein ACRDT6_19570 [Micromonosporaceae bacterium]